MVGFCFAFIYPCYYSDSEINNFSLAFEIVNEKAIYVLKTKCFNDEKNSMWFFMTNMHRYINIYKFELHSLYKHCNLKGIQAPTLEYYTINIYLCLFVATELNFASLMCPYLL